MSLSMHAVAARFGSRGANATTGRPVRQTGRTRRAWPLWAWAVFAAAAVGVVVTGGCITGLAIAGSLDLGALSLCLALGALGTAVAAVSAAFAADSAAEALRTMRDDAVARLRDPDAVRYQGPARGIRTSAEMAELDSAVEALALRMRVADEVANRSRASAEHTSAGMFELLSGAIAAEEAARGQLAAELHDTVAQSLAVARALLADGQQARATACVEDAEEQVRAVMARTRPPGLRDGDLAAAVSDFCADLEQRYGLVTEIRWPTEPRPLPLATAVTIYRFFQESLLNVLKHADVDDAELTLSFDRSRVIAGVRDDGPGFDPAAVRSQRGRHVGLGLLRERVRLAGGTLEVRSGSGCGTHLVMSMPMPAGRPTDDTGLASISVPDARSAREPAARAEPHPADAFSAPDAR